MSGAGLLEVPLSWIQGGSRDCNGGEWAHVLLLREDPEIEIMGGACVDTPRNTRFDCVAGAGLLEKCRYLGYREDPEIVMGGICYTKEQFDCMTGAGLLEMSLSCS